jgi:putative endonuclease
MNNREKGKFGEEFARKFLAGKGIEIIKENYFTKFGEIDLIGIEKKTIIFIEVKFRKNKKFGLPYESINNRKIEKIKTTAEIFLSENDYGDFDCRFDVVSINQEDGNFEIDWLKNQYLY